MIQRTAILQQLSTFVAMGVSRQSPVALSVPGTHGSFRATVVGLEQLAGVFSEIDYHMPAQYPLPTANLPQVGADLAQRLQYLLEPVAPVEFDGESAVLQMRSVPPSQEDAQTRSYFEVLVRPREISLRRYTAAAGQPRVAAEINLTCEVCARLGADLAAAHCAAFPPAP